MAFIGFILMVLAHFLGWSNLVFFLGMILLVVGGYLNVVPVNGRTRRVW